MLLDQPGLQCGANKRTRMAGHLGMYYRYILNETFTE